MDNLRKPSKMSVGSHSPQNQSIEELRYSHDYANIQNHLREALDSGHPQPLPSRESGRYVYSNRPIYQSYDTNAVIAPNPQMIL
jgi:hypothetical protein